MFIKRSPLYVAFLFILWPSVSMGRSFPFQKRSNLPCLAGNPEFSEMLIANNQYLSGRRYAMQDALLWDGILHVKRSIGPLSSAEIEDIKIRPLQGFSDFAHQLVSQIEGIGKPGALLEFGIYFNRLSMLYLSLFDRVALVIGDNSKPANVHLSIGNFPIHFGSGYTEYSLLNPLQNDMGVALNTRAASLNAEYYWNIEHKTKARGFTFMPFFPGESTYEGNKWGVNIQHEWKLKAKSMIDSMHTGVSWVSGLPFAKLAGENPDGFDIYMRINSKVVNVKLEGVIGDSSKWRQKWFSYARSKSSSKNPEKPISDLPYAVHGEMSFKLPFKKDVTAVTGYSWGGSEFLSASARVFLGAKVSLLENLTCLIGYHSENGLKTMKRNGIPRKGAVSMQQSAARRHFGEWRHSLAVQFNVTV